jgi:hypothetical protein
MYNNDVLKEEHAALRFSRFKNTDCVQQSVASMEDDLALREWELHTLDDMKWKDNHQRHIKYLSQDIIESISWLMWQPMYAKHLVYRTL